MVEIPHDIVLAAQASQARYYVPSSVSIAQWALESSWGAHMAPASNNPFGIKAVEGQAYVTASTWEVEAGRNVRKDQRFAKYASMADAFEAHAHLLATVHLYKPAMDAWYKARDLATGVALMAQHYATDPAYATKVMSIIRAHNLVAFDSLPQDARKPAPIAPAPKPAPPPAPPIPTPGSGTKADGADPLGGLLSELGSLVGSVIPASLPAGPSPGGAASQPATADTTGFDMNPLIIISAIQTFLAYLPKIEKFASAVPELLTKGEHLIADIKKMDVSASIGDIHDLIEDVMQVATDTGVVKVSAADIASVVSQAPHLDAIPKAA